jgi:general transcription factor 3C polypeptide 3 (transcription factor C subunit 4)
MHQVFPNSAEPYHTLGLLHEALGNSRKALDFYMIAAHLTAKVGLGT